MTLNLRKLNEKLYNSYLQRLENNHLEEYMNVMTDKECLRHRKIYEEYEQQLVQAKIVPSWNS